jgi:hypothetical protein
MKISTTHRWTAVYVRPGQPDEVVEALFGDGHDDPAAALRIARSKPGDATSD